MDFQTLDDAIACAMRHEEAEITAGQAIEFLDRYRGQLVGQKLVLMHEIFDCGCDDPDCRACSGTGFEYTETFEDDLYEQETNEEFVNGYSSWRLWKRDSV